MYYYNNNYYYYHLSLSLTHSFFPFHILSAFWEFTFSFILSLKFICYKYSTSYPLSDRYGSDLLLLLSLSLSLSLDTKPKQKSEFIHSNAFLDFRSALRSDQFCVDLIFFFFFFSLDFWCGFEIRRGSESGCCCAGFGKCRRLCYTELFTPRSMGSTRFMVKEGISSARYILSHSLSIRSKFFDSFFKPFCSLTGKV